MTTAESIDCLPVTAFVWPVTYRFNLSTTWGGSQEELTVNIPPLVYDFEATKRFGTGLWQLAVAGATSVLAGLTTVLVTAHRTGASELYAAPALTLGRYPGPPGGRDETACVQLHTGHMDKLAVRRFPVVGTPNAWVSDRLLTPTGLRIIESTMQTWRMGMTSELGPSSIEQLVKYDDVDLGPDAGVPMPVFRRVQYVRVLHHTVRAPAPSFG